MDVLKLIVEAAVNEAVVQGWIDGIIGDVNDFLSDYGMSVVYNQKYDFQSSSYYRDCYAVYQRGSVKNGGRIRIGLNLPFIYSSFKKKKWRQQIEVSIWHEVGHGIVELLKGFRRKDTQCGSKVFRGQMLKDFIGIIRDEEYFVEEFGDFMASEGYAMFSSLADFLENYVDEIGAVRDMEGGSKWLTSFRRV